MELVHLVMAETTFWTILLMIHGLFSMALIGALTHQAAAVLRAPAPADGLVARFGAVKGDLYASAVTGLWVASFIFGARPAMKSSGNGSRERSRANPRDG